MRKTQPADGERIDIYTRITETIVSAIEAGADKYEMPWNKLGMDSVRPVNAESHKPYRGVNVLMLWATAAEKGYSANVWGTYKQWQAQGAQVRKGEKSTPVVFWKFWNEEQKEAETPADAPARSGGCMARAYHVFNAAQVDGWEGNESTETPKPNGERIASAEQFFAATGARIIEGGDRAAYSPSADVVLMPKFEQFREPGCFYSVLAHECTHWTAAPARLNRSESLGKRFGSEAYAFEELIAEIGAAFVSAELDLETDPRTDHAPYIASWLKVLKNDKRAIFTAAAKAQQAADYLLQTTEAEEAA